MAQISAAHLAGPRGSWLLPGPALPITGIWGVKQHTEELFPSACLPRFPFALQVNEEK